MPFSHHEGRRIGARHAVPLAMLIALAACHPLHPDAPPTSREDDETTWLHAVPTPVIRQRHEADCGLAALAMLAGAWGRDWSVTELARALPPSARGVRLGALRDLARERGLEAYALHASPEDLAHELAYGRPVVLGLVLPYDRGRHRNHFELAVAMNPRTGTVETIDPATGIRQRHTSAVLDTEWKPAGYAALVVIADHERAARMANDLLEHHFEENTHVEPNSFP